MAKRMIGPFQLERQLGTGGMGVVYRATYVKTGQAVAVKVLTPALSTNPTLKKRFEREMAILKKLRHKNIVRYYGGGIQGTQHYYAMELMNGGTLEELIEKRKQLSWERVIENGVQIADALEYSHRHAIIHRDLKPANLFLTADGTLKLGDFGIARDTEATALTAAGRTVGTYAYMAPEQISGKPPVSHKTDLYALGCVLFEMLTGRTPFQANSAAEMLYQHLEQQPPRVRASSMDCPVWLEAVIEQLLAKDPEERYYDALAAQVALDEVRSKVAEMASVSQQTVSGGGTRMTAAEDQPELKKILGKKRRKKKKKKHVPVYERVWFLLACLVLLVGSVAWAVWPLSDAELFARGEQLMASEDSIDWDTARGKYLEPLLERSPEGVYATRVHEFIDKIEMHRAETRALRRARDGREPKSEAERLFIEAWRYEQFGDRITALEKYSSLVALLEPEKREEDRPFTNLARRQTARIEQSDDRVNDRVALVNRSLQRAEELSKRGELLKAREIWKHIETLYGTNLELQAQVRYARARREGVDAGPFEFGNPAPSKAPDAAAISNGTAPDV
jgi:serine/threonine-protein kinase